MHQRALGADNMISGDEIFMLAMDAGPRIDSQAISVVLQFLVESPDFGFETYVFKEDRLFLPCPPGHQLPIGKDYILSQYVVRTPDSTYRGSIL